MEQVPTVFKFGKAPVGVGYGDYAGESAGVGERGMLGKRMGSGTREAHGGLIQ